MITNRSISSLPSKAFTLMELLVSISIISVLAALSLTGVSSIKEKSRRVRCLNNLKQFLITSHLYANETEERLLPGKDNNNDANSSSEVSIAKSHTINLSDETMGNIGRLAGSTNIAYCPGFAHGWMSTHIKKYGYTIGYNYLGGHKFSTTNFPQFAAWRSPQRATEDGSLPLIADANHWATQDGWAVAPHGMRGPIREGGSFFVRSSGGDPSVNLGSAGGNVGYLDGSVVWKPVIEMKQHIASSHRDEYIGAW